jgi:hypothetical protein
VIQDWPEPSKDPKNTDGNYKFEERYIDKIDTRKIGDHFDEGYFPYFLKPEMMLSMPLPLLAKDLKATYPEVRLKAITDNIAKLNEKNKPKLTASDLAKQLSGAKPKSSIYKPQTNNSENFGFDPKTFGGTSFPGGGMPPGGGGIVPPGPGGVVPPGTGGAVPPGTGGTPKLPDGYNPNSGVAIPDEVENFLLRFVDCDVEPGRTYEYRIRLRMHNPNTGQDKLVANPEFAKKAYETLYSKWTQIDTPITLPAESFLYAYDVKNFREQTATTFEGQKELLNRMQVKDNQAVVQLATWMEQVRTDGTKREPVGAWVVTEIPVGRGEYIGRKQYVKLPLWSSEIQQYMLREVNDTLIVGPKGAGKSVQQPKGWLVDFSTKSILVDFEGGRVKSKVNVGFDQKGNLIQQQRTVEEDAATEMLIVRPDGKLVVRSSLADETDDNRKDISSKWAEWVKAVEGRKSTATGGTNEPNPFDPKKP